LGADAARQSEEVRAPFQDGIKAHLQVLEELMPEAGKDGNDERAMVVLSLLVGAVTLARIAAGTDLSDRLLDAAASEAKRLALPPK
jgi:TetR/AcrR family transcriptional repressor of nem operon